VLTLTIVVKTSTLAKEMPNLWVMYVATLILFNPKLNSTTSCNCVLLSFEYWLLALAKNSY
jgi:hypothetical protein